MKKKEEYYYLSRQILDLSNKEISRINFLNDLTDKILLFSGCDSIQLLFLENDKFIKCAKHLETRHLLYYKILPKINQLTEATIPDKFDKELYDLLIEEQSLTNLNILEKYFAASGSFFIGNINKLQDNIKEPKSNKKHFNAHKSTALIPIVLGKENTGVLILKSKIPKFLNKNAIRQFEIFAEDLGIALYNYKTQSELRERIKELSCIYRINQISSQLDISLAEIMYSIVKLIPSAWQYPEITEGRIILDNEIFETTFYKFFYQKQEADIIVKGKKRGVIEVVYKDIKPELDEGAFLKEERNLINAIPGQISMIVERKEAEKDKIDLQDQLYHADRLALLGQMAAGVAHELNEPIGSILGFAQLAIKSINNPGQAAKDIERIIISSVYSREIIKKLMAFVKEVPKNNTYVNLNNVVNEGLLFFESRCAKSGIELIKDLSESICEIWGDHYQFTQVLLNLVVNSIHAMPNGGKLTIKTSLKDEFVCLLVDDTGFGMNEETKGKIFIPFFTTKDLNEGTGLGLAVVRGIVKSYNGIIKVDSFPGKGTFFEILFPIK